MINHNHFSVIGNLTRDVELKYTPSGTPVANFSIANNNSYTSNGQKVDEVSYFNVVAWTKLAELCSEYLKKGKKVLIAGRLQQRRWETNDGEKRNVIEVVAKEVEFLTPMEKRQEQAPPDQRTQMAQEVFNKPVPDSANTPTDPVDDQDDIPF